jgi:hypothetical protein
MLLFQQRQTKAGLPLQAVQLPLKSAKWPLQSAVTAAAEYLHVFG